jgi:EAL domain-containing protein (putative c-di-GMP-specific phosphodiesterase class I)/CheY-like chemotaxis protein
MRAACAQIASWRAQGCEPVPIAINLSARQLRNAGFREALGAALREHGIEAWLLEVEITESSLMENPDEAQIALRELKAVGVTLAIDDFGTGYSSLAYLRRFPFDTLKIDRSFVGDISTNADDATIARTIIALAGSLGLTVVAEGVETEQQLAFLVANRCDQAQGYLFAKPVPADAATVLLKSRAPLHAPIARGVRSQTPAVLVVDGKRDRLIEVQQLLQRDSYQLLTASGIADALDVLAKHNVVVAIADETIGDASGAEFLRRVAAIDPQICRVMIGATADRRTPDTGAADAPVQRFFVKGRDDALLREEVKKMARRSYRAPALVRALTRKAVWGFTAKGRKNG